jgi:hypothetical protein
MAYCGTGGENYNPVAGAGYGGLTSTAGILVLFILLVIISKAFLV